jgi:hypothetical protein
MLLSVFDVSLRILRCHTYTTQVKKVKFSLCLIKYCAMIVSRDSDWLRAGRSSGRSSIPGTVKNFFHFVETGSGVLITSYPMDTRGLFPRG